MSGRRLSGDGNGSTGVTTGQEGDETKTKQVNERTFKIRHRSKLILGGQN